MFQDNNDYFCLNRSIHIIYKNDGILSLLPKMSHQEKALGLFFIFIVSYFLLLRPLQDFLKDAVHIYDTESNKFNRGLICEIFFSTPYWGERFCWEGKGGFWGDSVFICYGLYFK